MKFRTMSRHIRDASKSLVRNGWMTLAAISAVTMTLLLVGSFIAILFNVNKLASDIENDVSVRVFIDLGAEEADRETLRNELEKIPNVESLTYSTRDEELDKLIGSYGEEFNLFGGDDNPLHDVFILSAELPEQTGKVAETAGELNYVAKVEYGGTTAEKLFDTISTMRTIGIVIIVGLLLIAVFLISNTIRITIFSRSTEIEIMRLVGAKNSYIRWPFLIEGSFIGLIGSLIPTGILIFLYRFLYEIGTEYLVGSNFALLPANPFVYYIGLGLIGVGVFLGSIGSVLSMSRFLKV
ncbi:permease-like cell division protein FtsX [Jeotgalibaca ciconiae]|uniref:Cell division protein FtsX n=1 Tax=Jeotgalibaca ciconiae TaxID=2496265 RepID=A0A3Q9BMD3_9LACT|nr:permease-like cell division protein FtsX [Jeotgalibaca ciconiae]AZP04590.1 ABC transporter permease [Jeotgalibaca ciconiae]HJB23348.1 permease-like cell division protein FtsX [Candidatus Jeotgalibaca pullicola]